MDLKLLLKRGALIAAANWPVVAVQWAAQTTFKLLLSVTVVGAALSLATIVGGDQSRLMQGTTREIVASVSDTLASQPGALGAFLVAVFLVLVGGSVLLFLVKGGTMRVLLDAHEIAGPIEHEAITAGHLRQAFAFTLERFVEGCEQMFRRYLALGLALMVVYGLSTAAYLSAAVLAYRTGLIVLAAAASLVLFVWIMLVNLLYLLLQIACAAEDVGLARGARQVTRFVVAEYRDLGRVLLIIVGMLAAATLASALALSGVSLIAFVPIVGVVAMPVYVVVLLVQGLVFEYVGLVALGAYVTLYRRFAPATLLAGVPQAVVPRQGPDWEGAPQAPSPAQPGG